MSRSINYTSSPLLASKTPVWRSKFIVACLALAFAGLLIIFWPKLAGPRAELRGVVALVAAAASSALAAVLAKHGAHGIDSVAGTAWQMAGAALWLLLAGWALERPAPVARCTRSGPAI